MDTDFELNFLIVKYLRNVSPEAGKILEASLNDNPGLLPTRLDWTGKEHHQTFAQLEKQFPKVRGNHIRDLLQRLNQRSLFALPPPPVKETRLFSPAQYIQRSRLLLPPPVPRQDALLPVYKKLHLLRRTIGHLSAVFCLVFDKTGNYVFTGADDLLVKMWGTYNGRLYFTFRGASAEISDLAISPDNRLLAAGSTDKIIRVWCLRSASPIAVLVKNTGAITSIHFCPANLSGVPNYLAITSGDGTVSFWRYTYNKTDRNKKPVFDSEPTRYHEKMRPGGAQMICASFSPGGLFLATGSVDHHVRVYMMDGKDGPVKVLEQEVHSERVDSILWSNQPGLRFASGSKDGTARIWSFKFGEWHSQQLIGKGEDGRTLYYNTYKHCEENLRVTMTAWSCDDTTLTTALSDATLCVWDSKTCQPLHRLKGHKDEVYVLEPHPSHADIMLSGAHDGSIIVWQISTQNILFQHQNNIQGQGFGAIYDAKWSPTEMYLAASDSHGHVLFFGCSPNDSYKKCPEEMFFHTDYRPLLRDTAHHVVDEQSQLAPHLLPPPFLVDMEGNPYPADTQRLVPGREKLSDQEALAPNLLETQISPNRRRSGDRRRSSGGEGSSGRSGGHGRGGQPASNIDQLIEELAANSEALGADVSHDNLLSEHSYASPGRRQNEPRESREGAPSASTQDLTCSVWRKRELIAPSLYSCQSSDQSRRKENGIRERVLYKLEMSKKKTVRIGLESRHEGIERILGGRRGGRGGRARASRTSRNSRQPRAANSQPAAAENDDEEGEGEETEEEEDNQAAHSEATSDTSLEESDLESDESSSSSSTEYSDWGANNLTPPQRTARKSGRLTGSSKPASSEDERSDSENKQNKAQPSSSNALGKPGPSRSAKNNRKKNYTFNPTQLDDIPPEYLPSDWLAQFIPNKSPYFPQMGDEVMYIKQGHIGYINLVKNRNSYRLNMREQHCLQRDDIKHVELVKVIGMKHEIRPPRLCCLKLAIVDPETNTLTGENFSIKYHDMNDVVDFLVLKHNYEASINVKWKPGDRYRCQIEDAWWFGTVLEVSPFDPSVTESPFLSIKCLWDSGEEERLSPWDLDAVKSGDTGFEKTKESLPVTREEIERFLYSPTPEEWRGLDSRIECRRISAGLEQVMALAIAEPFNYPVDLQVYPDYMLEIEYPMDFSLIKSRLDNQFYRRITAVQFDVRYMATNAECYNRPKTDIVKNARILTDLVLKIIQDPELTDVNGEYHRLVDNFKWEDTQEARPGKSSSAAVGGAAGRSRRKSGGGGGATGGGSTEASPINPKQWKHDCNDLLKHMFEHEDSEPFRQPVSDLDFPDYSRFITSPMDLSTVRESLRVGEYQTPLEFKEDMELIFSNSFQYNTNRKAPVVGMTKRLKEYFLDAFQQIVKDWRKMNRRMTIMKKKGQSPATTPKKQANRTPQKRRKANKDTDYDSEDEDYEDPDEGTSRPRGRKGKAVKYEEESTEETSTEDTEDEEEEEEEERPARRQRKRKSKSVKYDDYASESDDEGGASSRNRGKGRRQLNLSDESDDDSHKDKGKGVSTKALSRRQQRPSVAAAAEEAAEEQLENGVEEEEERGERPKRSSNRKSQAVNGDDTDDDYMDEDVPISQRRGGGGGSSSRSKKRGGRKSREVPESDYEEEEEDDDLTETTEEEETEDFIVDDSEASDHEDYKPRRKRGNKYHEKRGKKKKKGKKRKYEDEESNAPRPRRQATAKALSRFAKSESDEMWSEEEQPAARNRNKRLRHEEENQPQRHRRHPGGGGASASVGISKTETVTISAADSSTDPRRRTESDEEQGYQDQGQSGSGRHAGRRPGRGEVSTSPRKSGKQDRQDRFSRDDDASRPHRKRSVPARLNDYSNDELMLEASRRGPRRRYEEPADEGSGDEERGRGKRARKTVRYAEDTLQDYRSDYEERSGSSRRRSGTRPNYLDQSISGDEDSRIPYTRRPRAVASPPPSSQLGEESQAQGGEEDTGRGRRQRGGGRREEVGPEDRDGEDSGEESDYGKRKRSRRVLSRRSAGGGSSGSGRPQRQAATARTGYRDLESSDEDLHPRRRARRNLNYREMHGADSELSEEDTGGGLRGDGVAGVSSRGRVRRPNRRLLD